MASDARSSSASTSGAGSRNSSGAGSGVQAVRAGDADALATSEAPMASSPVTVLAYPQQRTYQVGSPERRSWPRAGRVVEHEVTRTPDKSREQGLSLGRHERP